MNVSIITPTLNEADYVEDLLHSISHQEYDGEIEVIVVDGGSEDKTNEIVSNFSDIPVKLLKTEPSVSGQRNFGAENSKHDNLFFLDADSRILNSNFIAESIKEILGRELHVACPMYDTYDGRVHHRAIYKGFSTIFKLTQRFSPSGGGMGFFIQRDLFTRIGGFPNDNFEDMRLIRKAGETGNFGILKSQLHVSSRRFKREGTLKVLKKYSLVSYAFATGNLHHLNKIEYDFNK